MRWKDYQDTIVKKHGVQLIGWPDSFPFDIKKLREEEPRRLNDALDGGSCRWERVSIEETEARLVTEAASGDVNARPRKRRSDMGKKRKAVDDLHAAMKRRKGVPLPVESDDSDLEEDTSSSGCDGGNDSGDDSDDADSSNSDGGESDDNE